MKRKKNPTITLAGLVEHLGGAPLARAVGVDPSLPLKWRDGSRPSIKNARKIMAVAEKAGFSMTLEDALGGAQ